MSFTVVVEAIQSSYSCAVCSATIEEDEDVFVIYPDEPSKTTLDDAVVLEPTHAPELIDQLGSTAGNPNGHNKLGDTMRTLVVPIPTSQRCPICTSFVQEGDYAVEFTETTPQLRLHAECADELADALDEKLGENTDMFLSELL